MPRWLADENFNNDIVRALLRGKPDMDLVRVQDVGLMGCRDAHVLAWAAEQGRIVLSHDVTTLTEAAYHRVLAGEAMPGVFEAGLDVPVRVVVEDLLLVDEVSLEGEWEGQVRYLPLR